MESFKNLIFVANRSAFDEIVLACCLLSNVQIPHYQVLPSTGVQQLCASDKSSKLVPATFAGKNPLVSAWFLWQMCVVQLVDSNFTDSCIVVIIHVLFFPSFLPFPCVCRRWLRWLLLSYLIHHKVLCPPVPHLQHSLLQQVWSFYLLCVHFEKPVH